MLASCGAMMLEIVNGVPVQAPATSFFLYIIAVGFLLMGFAGLVASITYFIKTLTDRVR